MQLKYIHTCIWYYTQRNHLHCVCQPFEEEEQEQEEQEEEDEEEEEEEEVEEKEKDLSTARIECWPKECYYVLATYQTCF